METILASKLISRAPNTIGTTSRLQRCMLRCTVRPQLISRQIYRVSSTQQQVAKPVVNPDGLPRYPGLNTPNGILRTMDWIGTVAFATSGTLCAGYAGMDFLGCTIVGTITAVGGGTVRDILLGNFPVFWMVEYEYILMCLAACGVVLVSWGELEKRNIVKENGPVMFWTDTMGIGAFCVIGAQNGIRAGMHPVICVLCGMFTATFGGLIRDVLCDRPPRILYSVAEVYASTALSGATVFMLVRGMGGSPGLRIFSGVATAMGLRYYATKYNINLPSAQWKNVNLTVDSPDKVGQKDVKQVK